MEDVFEDKPFETAGGRPIIAYIGQVFNADNIVLIEQAANELNLTEEEPRYQLTIDRDNMFAANGSRLPKDFFRVRIQGTWLSDKSIKPLWERVEELRTEQSQDT